MRRELLLLPLVLVMLVAMLALGTWWHASGAEVQLHDPDVVTPVGAAPTTIAAPAAGGAAGTTPDDEVADETADAVTTREARRRKARHERPQAQPTLVGRVVSPIGLALEGVRVLGAPTSDVGDPRHTWPLDAAGVLGASGMRETTTDADGRFELTGLPAGRVRLALRKAAHAARDVDGLLLARDGSTDAGDLELGPGRALSGRVGWAGGAPVEGAAIHLLAPERDTPAGGAAGPLIGTTGEQGTFTYDELPPGRWSVLVRSAQHAETRFDDLVTDSGPVALDLVLPEPASITGDLVLVPPQGSDHLVVHAVPAELLDTAGIPRDGERVDDAALPSAFVHGRREARAGPGGTFVVEGLDPQTTYVLRALPPGADVRGFDPWSPPVLATAGARGVRLEVQGSATLTFRVVDVATGAPVTRIELEDAWSTADPSAHWGLQRGADGRVTLANARPNRAQGFELSLRAEGYAPHTVALELSPGEHRDLGTVQLERLSSYPVLVLDDTTGEPIEDARVHLHPRDPEGLHRGTLSPCVTDEEGLGALADLSRVPDLAGVPLVLGAQAPGYAPLVVPFSWPTSEPFEVRLGPGGTVTVEVSAHDYEGLGGLPIVQRTTDRDLVMAFGDSPSVLTRERTDADGKVTFVDVPPGPNRVELARAERDLAPHEWTPVHVVAGETHTVRLGLDPLGRLVGTVVEEGEGLPGASIALEPTFPLVDPHGPVATRTDNRGNFELADLEPGDWRMVVRHAGRVMPAALTVEVRAGLREVEIDLPVTTVLGQVVDADGEPQPGVRVGVGNAWTRFQLGDTLDVYDLEQPEQPELVATTDADGTFALRGVDADVGLVVEAVTNGASGTARLEAIRMEGPVGGVEVVLEPDASLAIVGLGAVPPQGGPWALVLSAEGRVTYRTRPRVVFPFEGGDVFVDGLPPGRWQVHAAAVDGFGHAASLDRLGEVELVPGELTAFDVREPR